MISAQFTLDSQGRADKQDGRGQWRLSTDWRGAASTKVGDRGAVSFLGRAGSMASDRRSSSTSLARAEGPAQASSRKTRGETGVLTESLHAVQLGPQ